MGLATLIFFIYVVSVPIGLILFALWLMNYLSRLSYAPEKRILFTATALVCLIIIAFSIGAKINKWRAPPAQPVIPTTTNAGTQATNNTLNAKDTNGVQQEQRVPDEPIPGSSTLAIGAAEQALTETALNHEQQLELFESTNYPGLYEQRMGLIDEIGAQQTFLKRLEELANYTPKQRRLLVDIYLIRKAAFDKLKQRNVSISQHLRDFWVHYNTGNSHDATTKFTPVANQLVKKIQESRGQLLDSKRREGEVIKRHLRQAGLALKNNTIPAHQAGKITTYTRQNRALITDWLSRNGHIRTLEVLERLQQERIIISDRYKQVVAFQKRYPDLTNRLNRTLKLWAKAQETNYYAEYRLLYAAESRYIIDHMGLDSGKVADERLDKELNAYTEFVAGHAEDALEKAEQAYKPDRLR